MAQAQPARMKATITMGGDGLQFITQHIAMRGGCLAEEGIAAQPLGGGSNMLAAMEKGSTDGFAWGAPQAQIAVERKLGIVAINPFSGEVPEVTGVRYHMLVTSRQTLGQKPQLIKATVRAYARAMKFAAESPDKAQALVRKQFPEIDEVIFNKAWDDYRKGIPSMPVITREQIQRAATWLNITSAQPVVADYGRVVYADFAQAAARDDLGK